MTISKQSFISSTGSTKPSNPQQREIYTASGNWTCPPGVTMIYAAVFGAGGAPGGRGQTASYLIGYGGAGGAGGSAGSWIAVTPGVTYPIVIGATGTAGTDVYGSTNQTVYGNAGTAGGLSSFGGVLIGYGGGGGGGGAAAYNWYYYGNTGGSGSYSIPSTNVITGNRYPSGRIAPSYSETTGGSGDGSASFTSGKVVLYY